jgi:hypothetical protein
MGILSARGIIVKIKLRVKKVIAIRMALLCTGLSIIACSAMIKKNVIKSDMTREDVQNIITCSDDLMILTGPSQFRQGCSIMSGGVKFLLAFDESGHLLKILTNSREYRLPNGLHVGSTLAEIKQNYNEYKITAPTGYGRLVVIENQGVAFGFSWKEGSPCAAEVLDTDEVACLELSEIELQ